MRRQKLQAFAKAQFALGNHCQILVNIYAKACGLVRNISGSYETVMFSREPMRVKTALPIATALIDDLFAVLIGDGFTLKDGRG
jgi:hypothetical protein